jgi:hypothetical protein
VLEEWWDNDYDDYLWDEDGGRYEIEAVAEEVCVLDKDNMAKLRSHHNACVD